MYNKTQYNNEYARQHYKPMNFRIAKGTKQTLQQMADDYGKSIAAFVMDAVKTKYAGEWDALQVSDES